MAAKKLVVTTVVVYKDDAGEWRWTAFAANNKKVATSGEGYRNRKYAAKVAKDLYPDAELEWGLR